MARGGVGGVPLPHTYQANKAGNQRTSSSYFVCYPEKL